MDKLNEIEARLFDKLEGYCRGGHYWESAESVSHILVNIAALKAIAEGGKARCGPGGVVVDPPRGKDS